jgi:hypothetical protein
LNLFRSTVLAAFVVASLGGVARAQDDMVKRRDDLLKEEWLKKADWITDYDKAREEAKKSGKMIFGYFTRSYAT